MPKPRVTVGKTARKTPEGKLRVGHEPPETSRQVDLLHRKQSKNIKTMPEPGSAVGKTARKTPEGKLRVG
jgi:hypothetical protein